MALLYFTQTAGVYVVYGLSTDTKPSSPVDGSLFVETDTDNTYLAASGAWTLPTDQKYVLSLADLPPPVGGVITLADNVNYIIAGEVDISPNRIVCGMRCGIRGTNRVNDRIVSDTTGVLFTIASNITVVFNELGLRCPNGTLLSVANTGVAMIDCSIGPVANGGNIALSGAFPFTFRQGSIVSGFTTTGFTFTGTTTGVLRIFDNTLSNNAGTLFALGAAVFGSIDISRNAIISNASQTFLSGSGSSNITLGGHLDGNTFSGAGTMVSGIAGTDSLWLWTSSIGVTNTPVSGGTTGIDGGLPNSIYEGTTPIDGGSP